MDNIAVSKLLICFLLAISSARIFYIKNSRVDVLSVVVLVAFVLNVIDVATHGFDFFSVLIFIISIVSLLSNIRALLRFFENLYVDRYSTPFVISSVFVFIMSVVISLFILIFYPIRLTPKKLHVQENVFRLIGSFRSGLVPASSFEKSTVIATVFSPLENTFADNSNIDTEKSIDSGDAKIDVASKPIVVLLCDKRGDSINYRPYMIYLAQKGYTVMAADFFVDEARFFDFLFNSKLFRKMALCIMWRYKQNMFESKKANYTRIITQEAAALIKIVQANYGKNKKIFFIGDGMAEEACFLSSQTNSQVVSDFFLLSTVENYKTSGFGFVEQTNPFLAKYFFDLKRDKNFSVPKILADETDVAIKQIFENNTENNF